MMKILIIFAHPAFQKSRVNAKLVEGIDQIDGVTFHDIYDRCPEFDLDIKNEQALLEAHDVIAFHHPFFWYSTPAILKEWQDLVLEHGWAYGSEGNALKDKLFFNIITTGGGAEAYCTEGYNRHTLRQLLAPIEQTATLCKMVFLPPYVVHGTHSITEEQIQTHKENYHRLLSLFRDEKVDFRSLRSLEYLNHFFTESRQLKVK